MSDANNDTSVNLIRALVENVSGPVVDWDNWTSMAIVIDSFDGRFNSASGSLYSPDGTISIVAARPSAVLPFVITPKNHKELREALRPHFESET